jgi:hypothetical protein
MKLSFLAYLDCVGIMASLINRILLRQSLPNKKQIKFWDSYLVPLSVHLDKIIGFNLGKTVLGIWEKP